MTKLASTPSTVFYHFFCVLIYPVRASKAGQGEYRNSENKIIYATRSSGLSQKMMSRPWNYVWKYLASHCLYNLHYVLCVNTDSMIRSSHQPLELLNWWHFTNYNIRAGYEWHGCRHKLRSSRASGERIRRPAHRKKFGSAGYTQCAAKLDSLRTNPGAANEPTF